MEPTVEKKWACLQRREWNSGPCGAIERLPGGSFAVIHYLQEQEGIHLEVKARKVA